MQVITENSIQVCAGFRALSDPLRMQIVELLGSQELCVCELCDRLNVSQSKLSFHLKNLKEADLVFSRQQGRWIYYSLNLTQFAALESYLAQYQNFGKIRPSKGCE